MQGILFLGGLGAWEVILILGVFVLLFGAKKIPELARGIGKGIREFKDASRDIKNEIEENIKEKTEEKPKV
ncbi:MAG: twin-arginine translocase TatA/TatE family subunit [Chitinophagaceae bacterium]|nr:twin-arginine translocase TatA/TatE family subunit [Chitinophagaceae bacterium]